MRKSQSALAVILVAGVGLFQTAVAEEAVAPAIPGSDSTADHSKFEIPQHDFKSGPEVTAACLSCHTEADSQVMHSIHWSWSFTQPVTGQLLGKRNVINAFCGNVAANEPRCTSCHTG